MANSEIIPAPRKTAAEVRAEERAARSNIDRIILRNARLSLEEIGEKVGGMHPAEVGERLDNLLRSRDHLSERQEERLLIIEMGDLIDEVRNRMNAANDDNYADIANVALRGYEAISKRMDARRKLSELDISEISRAQGEMFLAIIIEAISRVSNWFEEVHPDLDFDIRTEMEEAFDLALPEARDEVNRRVRE